MLIFYNEVIFKCNFEIVCVFLFLECIFGYDWYFNDGLYCRDD